MPKSSSGSDLVDFHALKSPAFTENSAQQKTSSKSFLTGKTALLSREFRGEITDRKVTETQSRVYFNRRPQWVPVCKEQETEGMVGADKDWVVSSL